jgi:8-oxo-dGTP pyrophosphatase MutT (NUDIX family)
VEPDEEPPVALERELQEELGIVASPGRPWRRMREPGLELVVWVLTAWTGTVENRSPEEHSELRWFRRSEIEGLAYPHPGYPTLLADAFARIEGGEAPPT